MMKISLFFCSLSTVASLAAPPTFDSPVRLTADGQPISMEAPGYAAPCAYDIDGDGDQDLLVGQFRDGKIHVFINDGKGNLGKGSFLKAGSKVAKIPGVW